MFEIKRYSPEKKMIWNEFVNNSRNSTFLFCRDYMDYHADRFEDFSLMIYKREKLMALLPANVTDDGIVHSHSGLSYGGLLLPKAHVDGGDVLDIFGLISERLRSDGMRALDYRPLPDIYASMPSQEDIYALFRLGARVEECNLSAAIDLNNQGGFNKLQRRHLSKALQSGVKVTETHDIDRFMNLLADCLAERHDTKPVHSAAEMHLLAERFPRNIRFFAAILDGEMHAGVCIYDTGVVAHAQYIATDALGRELNLLAPLFDYLINREFCNRKYFDFGISNEDHGRFLNRGLLRQKYSYGATGVAQLKYYLPL